MFLGDVKFYIELEVFLWLDIYSCPFLTSATHNDYFPPDYRVITEELTAPGAVQLLCLHYLLFADFSLFHFGGHWHSIKALTRAVSTLFMLLARFISILSTIQ